VKFDARLSSSRVNLVNALFDQHADAEGIGAQHFAPPHTLLPPKRLCQRGITSLL